MKEIQMEIYRLKNDMDNINIESSQKKRVKR